MTHSLVGSTILPLSSGGQQRTGSVDSTRRNVEPKQENLPSPLVWCKLSENISKCKTNVEENVNNSDWYLLQKSSFHRRVGYTVVRTDEEKLKQESSQHRIDMKALEGMQESMLKDLLEAFELRTGSCSLSLSPSLSMSSAILPRIMYR